MTYQRLCLYLLGVLGCLVCHQCSDDLNKDTTGITSTRRQNDLERERRQESETEVYKKLSNEQTESSLKKSKPGKIKQKPLDNIAQKPFKDKNGDIVTAHSAQHYPYLVLPSVRKNEILSKLVTEIQNKDMKRKVKKNEEDMKTKEERLYPEGISDGKRNLVQFRDSFGKIIATLRDPGNWNNANVSLSKTDDARRFAEELKSVHAARHKIETGDILDQGMNSVVHRNNANKKTLNDEEIDKMIDTGKFNPKILETDKNDLKNDSVVKLTNQSINPSINITEKEDDEKWLSKTRDSNDMSKITNITIIPQEKMVHIEPIRDKPIDFNYELPEDTKANELPTDWKSLLHADDVSDHINFKSEKSSSHSKENGKEPCNNDTTHTHGVLREHTGDQRETVRHPRRDKNAGKNRRHSKHKHRNRHKNYAKQNFGKSKREAAMLPIEFYDELDQMNEIEEEPNAKVISSPKRVAAHASIEKSRRKNTTHRPGNNRNIHTMQDKANKKTKLTFKRQKSTEKTANIRRSEIMISRKNATSFLKNKKSEIDQMSESDFLAHTTPSIHGMSYDDDSADESDVRKTFDTSSLDETEHEKSNEKPKLVASYENYNDDENEVTKNSKAYDDDREEMENNEKDPVDLSYNDDVYVADGNAVVTKENNNEQYSEEEQRRASNRNSFVSSDDYISDSEPLLKQEKDIHYFTRVFHPTTIDKTRTAPTAEKQEDGASMKKTNTEEIKEITDVLEDPAPDRSVEKKKDFMHPVSNETKVTPISAPLINQNFKTDHPSENKHEPESLGFKTIQAYNKDNNRNMTKTNDGEEGKSEPQISKAQNQTGLKESMHSADGGGGERNHDVKDKGYSGPPDEDDIIDAKFAGDKKVKEYMELMKKLTKPTSSGKTEKMNDTNTQKLVKKLATVIVQDEKEKQSKEDQIDKEDDSKKTTKDEEKFNKANESANGKKTNKTFGNTHVTDKTESKIIEKMDGDILIKAEQDNDESDRFSDDDKEAKTTVKGPTKININLHIKPDGNLIQPTAQTVLNTQHQQLPQQQKQYLNSGSPTSSSDETKSNELVSINPDTLKESLKNAFRDFAKEIKSETQKQKSKQQPESENKKPSNFLNQYQDLQKAYQMNQQQYQPNMYGNPFVQTLLNSLQNNPNNFQPMQQLPSTPNYVTPQGNNNNNNADQTKLRVDIPGSSIPRITPPNAYDVSSMYNPVPTYIYNNALPYAASPSPTLTNTEGMLNRKETVNKPLTGYFAPTRNVMMDDYLKSQIRRVSELKPSIEYDSTNIYPEFIQRPTVSEENSQRRQDGTTSSSYPCNPMPQCESPQPILQTPAPYVESPKPVLQMPIQYPPPVSVPPPQTVAAAPQTIAVSPPQPQPQVVQQAPQQIQQQPQQVVVPQVVSRPALQLASPTQSVLQATAPPTTTPQTNCQQPPCDFGPQDCANPPCMTNQWPMSNGGCSCPDNMPQCSCMPNGNPQFDVQSMMMQVQCTEPPCFSPMNNNFMQNLPQQPCFNPPCDNFMTPPCSFPPCFPNPQQCQNPPCNKPSSPKATQRPVVVVKPPEARPQTIVIRKPAPPPKVVKIVRHASPKIVYQQPTQPPKKVVYAQAPPQQTIIVQRPTLPPKIVYAEPPKRKVQVVAAEPEVVVEKPVVIKRPQIIESAPVIQRAPTIIEEPPTIIRKAPVAERVVEPQIVAAPPVSVAAPPPVSVAAPPPVSVPAPPIVVTSPPVAAAPPPVIATPPPPVVVATPPPVVVTPPPVVAVVTPAIINTPPPVVVPTPRVVSGKVITPVVSPGLQNAAQFNTFLNLARSSNLIDEVPLRTYTASRLSAGRQGYIKRPGAKVDCRNPLYFKTKNCLFDFKKEANQIKSSTYLKSSDSIERLVKGISQKARANGGSINSALEDQISDYVAEAIVDARKSHHKSMYPGNRKNPLQNGLRQLDLEETRGFVRHEIYPKLNDLHFQRSTDKPTMKTKVVHGNRTENNAKQSFLFPESKLKPLKTHLKLGQQPIETIRRLMEVSRSSKESAKQNDFTSISTSYKNWQKYYKYLQGKTQNKPSKNQAKPIQEKKPIKANPKSSNRLHMNKVKSPVVQSNKESHKHDKTSFQEVLNHLKKELEHSNNELIQHKPIKNTPSIHNDGEDVTKLPVMDLFEKLRNKRPMFAATEHYKVSRKHHVAPSLFNFIASNETMETEEDLSEQPSQSYILYQHKPSGEKSNFKVKEDFEHNNGDNIKEIGSYMPISEQPVSWHSNADELDMQKEVGNHLRREENSLLTNKNENYVLSNDFSSYKGARLQAKDDDVDTRDFNYASRKNLDVKPFGNKVETSDKLDKSYTFSEKLINKLSDKARMMLQSTDKKSKSHSQAPSIMNDELSNNFDSDVVSSYSSAIPTKFYEFEYDVNKNNKYAAPTMRELKRMEITLSRPDADVSKTVRKIQNKIDNVITKLSIVPNGYKKVRKVKDTNTKVGHLISKKGRITKDPNQLIAIDITPKANHNPTKKRLENIKKRRKIIVRGNETKIKIDYLKNESIKTNKKGIQNTIYKNKKKLVNKSHKTNRKHVNNKHVSKRQQKKNKHTNKQRSRSN